VSVGDYDFVKAALDRAREAWAENGGGSPA
jgi:hypothetical protein